jgi:hypothetical protein
MGYASETNLRGQIDKLKQENEAAKQTIGVLARLIGYLMKRSGIAEIDTKVSEEAKIGVSLSATGNSFMVRIPISALSRFGKVKWWATRRRD